jgi:hyperosmotically inducible protein
MKKIILSSLVAVVATAFIGCETTTNTNVKVNGNTVSNNTAAVINSNTTTNANISTNANKEVSRTEYDKDRAKYEAEKGASTIGQGANDSWIWFKTKSALATTNELRDSTINVDVSNDVVTLKGTVATAAEKAKAEEVAKAIEGVKSVTNSLKVDAKDSLTNQATSGATNATNTNTNKK